MILTSVSENANRFYNTTIDETAGLMPYDYSSCLTVDEACLSAMQETANDFDSFTEALRQAEIEFVQENGVEMIYEAEGIKEMISEGVRIVQEWFKRIMGVIDRFMKEVASKIALARTKFSGKIGDKVGKEGVQWKPEWNFKEFNYFHSNVDFIIGAPLIGVGSLSVDHIGTSAESSEESTKFLGGLKDTLHKEYGNVSEITVKEIKKYALGEDKVEFDGSDKDKAVEVITSGYKKGLEDLGKMKSDAKTATNSLIKRLKGLAKENKDEKKAYNAIAKSANKITSLNTVLISAKLSLLMGRLNLSYKICGILARSASKAGTAANDTKAKASAAAGKAGEKVSGAAGNFKDKMKSIGKKKDAGEEA